VATLKPYFGTYPESTQVSLDAGVAAFLAQGAGMPPVETWPIGELRAALAQFLAALPKLDEPVGRVDERMVAGPHGVIPVRVYSPAGSGPWPMLLFVHGGGWVMGSVDTHDDLCRSLCHRVGAVVISVGYRLAPEHRFPVALDECVAVMGRAVAAADELGGDGGRIAVAGDSSGGNLVAALTLRLRDEGGRMPGFQVLICPALNYGFDTASYHELAEGFGLNRTEMMYYWDRYLADPADGASPYASPLRAEDLGGLPPALIITGGFDVLHDEAEAYAARLARAGVPVRLTRYSAMNHNFVLRAGMVEEGRRGLDEIAAALRRDWLGEGGGVTG
jgi:acetyl esterase